MKIPGDRDWARQWSSLKCGPISGSEKQANYPADEHSSLLDMIAFQNRPAQQRQLHIVLTCGVPLKCPQWQEYLSSVTRKSKENKMGDAKPLFACYLGEFQIQIIVLSPWLNCITVQELLRVLTFKVPSISACIPFSILFIMIHN